MSMSSVIATLVAASLLAPPSGQSQTPATPARDQIALGATTPQRDEAARVLVPLLDGVRRRTQSGVSVQPGSVPDSPFAGTQTTLFAFTIGQRSVPVDPRVVAAMDRLAAWRIDDPQAVESGRLFDDWLGELLVKNATAVMMRGGGPPCDVECVARRMTTLDESWGVSSRGRAEARDEMLLEALIAAVLK